MYGQHNLGIAKLPSLQTLQFRLITVPRSSGRKLRDLSVWSPAGLQGEPVNPTMSKKLPNVYVAYLILDYSVSNQKMASHASGQEVSASFHPIRPGCKVWVNRPVNLKFLLQFPYMKISRIEQKGNIISKSSAGSGTGDASY